MISSIAVSTNRSVTYSSTTDCSVNPGAWTVSVRSTSERRRNDLNRLQDGSADRRRAPARQLAARWSLARVRRPARAESAVRVPNPRSTCSASRRRMPSENGGGARVSTARNAPISPPNSSRIASPTTLSASPLPPNRVVQRRPLLRGAIQLLCQPAGPALRRTPRPPELQRARRSGRAAPAPAAPRDWSAADSSGATLRPRLCSTLTVPVHARPIATLALARLEQRLGIVEHQQATPLRSSRAAS